MQYSNEAVLEVLGEVRESQSLKELYIYRDCLMKVSPEICDLDDFKKVFDETETKFSEVDLGELPTESLLDRIREAKGQVAVGRAEAKVTVRPHVRYVVNRHARLWKMTPQAMALVIGILETGKEVVTEPEMYELCMRLRAEGKLGGAQHPFGKVFRYYLAEGENGFKTHGFLTKLG